MRAYEFPVKLNAAGSIELPAQLAALLADTPLARVILLIPETADVAEDTETETEEDAAWERLGAEEFLAGYSEADAVYDRM